MTKTRPFDAADYLDSPGMIVEYLNEALATGDDKVIARAVGTIARTKGMSAVAGKAGLSRPSLYRALSEGGKPELATLMKVLAAIGVRLVAKARREPRQGRQHIAGHHTRQHSRRRVDEHA